MTFKNEIERKKKLKCNWKFDGDKNCGNCKHYHNSRAEEPCKSCKRGWEL